MTRALTAALDPRIARRLHGRVEHRKQEAGKVALLNERRQLLADLANPPEGADMAALATRADEVTDALAAIKNAEETRVRLAAAHNDTDDTDDGDGTEQRGVFGAGAGQANTPPAVQEIRLGQAFTASPAFREMEGRSFTGSAAVQVPGEIRTLLDSTIFPAPKERQPFILGPRERPVRLLDLMDRQSMDSTEIEWIQEATYSDNPAETAEGALKPEAAFTATLQSTKAATVANWINMTRQSAADNKIVQGYVQGRLTRGLLRRLEGQIVNGNGTAPNMRGILNTVGIGAYVAPASEAAVISVRKAKTVAQLSEYEPDTLVLNPTAWQRIELSADTTGQFRVNSAVVNALVPRIWGLTVVVSTVIAAATGLLGSFAEGATLWERDGITLLMTDSHASNFTSNILTLLVEMRAALTVWRPAAFVAITFDAAGN